MEKKKYKTEQRRQLLEFLSEHKEEQFTIDEMISRMEPEHMPGKSTIYRLVKELVEDGVLKRSNRDNSRQFVYQLLDGKECGHHFHMQCEGCGKLIHLKEEETSQVRELIQLQEKFKLDVSRCMFYGTCEQCDGK